jgi:hypothetical protein
VNLRLSAPMRPPGFIVNGRRCERNGDVTPAIRFRTAGYTSVASKMDGLNEKRELFAPVSVLCRKEEHRGCAASAVGLKRRVILQRAQEVQDVLLLAG